MENSNQEAPTGLMQSRHYDRPETSLASIERSTLSPKHKPKDILIRSLHHGYIITVGCQEFAIESETKLVLKLSEYLKDPQKIEQAWADGKFEI